MNNDLISREGLKEEVKTLFCPDGYKIMMLERIDSAPAVIKCSMTSDGLPLMDLRPKPQGKWEQAIPGFNDFYKCNMCEGLNPVKSKFCPHCGADMRKGGAE